MPKYEDCSWVDGTQTDRLAATQHKQSTAASGDASRPPQDIDITCALGVSRYSVTAKLLVLETTELGRTCRARRTTGRVKEALLQRRPKHKVVLIQILLYIVSDEIVVSRRC